MKLSLYLPTKGEAWAGLWLALSLGAIVYLIVLFLRCADWGLQVMYVIFQFYPITTATLALIYLSFHAGERRVLRAKIRQGWELCDISDDRELLDLAALIEVITFRGSELSDAFGREVGERWVRDALGALEQSLLRLEVNPSLNTLKQLALQSLQAAMTGHNAKS